MSATNAVNQDGELANYLKTIRSISPMDNMIPDMLPPEQFEQTTEIEAFKPKANCNKCYGRGHRGIQTETGNYILCKCVRKKMMAGVEEASGD